ncbi:hypothetical protein PPH41_36375 [Burkholderia gladioli]|nr:hypothetical protein [Burkholderia gladioli]
MPRAPAPASPKRLVHACIKTVRFFGQVGRGYIRLYESLAEFTRASDSKAALENTMPALIDDWVRKKLPVYAPKTRTNYVKMIGPRFLTQITSGKSLVSSGGSRTSGQPMLLGSWTSASTISQAAAANTRHCCH